MHKDKISSFFIGATCVGVAAGIALAVKSILENKIELTVVTEKSGESDDLCKDNDSESIFKGNTKDEELIGDKFDDALHDDEVNELRTSYAKEPLHDDFIKPQTKPSKVLRPYITLNHSKSNNIADDEPSINQASDDIEIDYIETDDEAIELNFDDSGLDLSNE